LTNTGEVYAWGSNQFGQIGNGNNENQLIPIKVKGFNNEKVIQISCGYCHSMALTESGRVFSWGYCKWGQLGHNNTDNENKPSTVLLSNEISIQKISCGFNHSLLLSRDRDIYWFGFNGCEKRIIPKKLTTIENKYIDIASHSELYISIAITVENVYYVWGKCGPHLTEVPEVTELKSFHHIFINYFGITFRTFHGLDESFLTLFSLKRRKYENNFNEIRIISSGNFGIVCKAVDKNFGKTFAIKKIPFNKNQKEKLPKNPKSTQS
jgi:hypothetical protein